LAGAGRQLLHPRWLEIRGAVLERGLDLQGHPRLAAWTRRRTIGAAAQARPVVGLEIECKESRSDASEGGLGHRQLEDVVEDPPTAVQFPLAVTRDVPCGPRPRGQLVAEREVDRLDARPCRAVERHG